MAYRVGEAGPETLIMPRDGFVIPNGGPAGGSPNRATTRVEHVVRVVPERDSFIRLAEAAAAPMVAAGHESAVSTAEGRIASGMAESQRRGWR